MHHYIVRLLEYGDSERLVVLAHARVSPSRHGTPHLSRNRQAIRDSDRSRDVWVLNWVVFSVALIRATIAENFCWSFGSGPEWA